MMRSALYHALTFIALALAIVIVGLAAVEGFICEWRGGRPALNNLRASCVFGSLPDQREIDPQRVALTRL